MNMVTKVLDPITAGQPALLASNLQWIVTLITRNLIAANIIIAIVQIALGVLFLSGRWVRETVIFSIVWALLVWYGGEGMSLLLTGQGSALTGAPGAVLLYPLIGLLVYPRTGSDGAGSAPTLGVSLRSRRLLVSGCTASASAVLVAAGSGLRGDRWNGWYGRRQ